MATLHSFLIISHQLCIDFKCGINLFQVLKICYFHVISITQILKHIILSKLVQALLGEVDTMLDENTYCASYTMAWRALLAAKGYGSAQGKLKG